MCVGKRERERERDTVRDRAGVKKEGEKGDRRRRGREVDGVERKREREGGEGGRWRYIQTERQTIRKKEDKYIHRERVCV